MLVSYFEVVWESNGITHSRKENHLFDDESKDGNVAVPQKNCHFYLMESISGRQPPVVRRKFKVIDVIYSWHIVKSSHGNEDLIKERIIQVLLSQTI